jgi:hypothetical protein
LCTVYPGFDLSLAASHHNREKIYFVMRNQRQQTSAANHLVVGVWRQTHHSTHGLDIKGVQGVVVSLKGTVFHR